MAKHTGAVTAAILIVAASAWAQAPVAPEFTVNTATIAQLTAVAVSSRANGDFVVVWDAAYGANDFRATGQRFDRDGQRVGAEFLVAASTNMLVRETKVAVDPAGGFMVVWSQIPSGGSVAYGRRYDAAGAGSAGFPLSSAATAGTGSPDVAADAAGNFDVFGQRFAAGGARLGAEFALGAPTSDIRHSPTVRFQDDGDFVAVW